jgi:YesN/AraC family two-component response regulator
MNKIKVLLADDQLLFVESLKNVLETRAKDIQVVGIAHNGEEAVRMADKLSPDIVLMDVRMPVLDGVGAVRIIHEKHPEIQVMMLTTFDDDEYVREALTSPL